MKPSRRDCIVGIVHMLHEAVNDAEKFRQPHWEFAPSLFELMQTGARGTDIRWMIANGIIDHATELLQPGKSNRSFQSMSSFSLRVESCFVLTKKGLSWASRVSSSCDSKDSHSMKVTDLCKPNWDIELRELTWRGLLVKRFRTPSACQELILAAFQEEDWPQRIDDPLQPVRGQDPKARLHDIIRRLNSRQRVGRLRFTKDGTGKGICWQS